MPHIDDLLGGGLEDETAEWHDRLNSDRPVDLLNHASVYDEEGYETGTWVVAYEALPADIVQAAGGISTTQSIGTEEETRRDVWILAEDINMADLYARGEGDDNPTRVRDTVGDMVLEVVEWHRERNGRVHLMVAELD